MLPPQAASIAVDSRADPGGVALESRPGAKSRIGKGFERIRGAHTGVKPRWHAGCTIALTRCR